MLIESKGFYISNYYVPPFYLEKGELLIIDIIKDIPFYKFESSLADIFSGKKNDKNVTINFPFLFTGRTWSESRLRSIFNPTTIKKYIEQHTSDCQIIIEAINSLGGDTFLELKYLRGEDRMSSLEATPFRLISLFAALNKSKYIFTDVIGQNIEGVELVWDIIDENIKNEGCCIVIDHFGYSNFTEYAKRFKRIEI